mmetsp:Transcript_88595/g.235769  ORF Transcript_88595/g.235769 Transcript_88595/m.235769 type:complete len:288 (-) Transcript_88595:2444-3307(-)
MTLNVNEVPFASFRRPSPAWSSCLRAGAAPQALAALRILPELGAARLPRGMDGLASIVTVIVVVGPIDIRSIAVAGWVDPVTLAGPRTKPIVVFPRCRGRASTIVIHRSVSVPIVVALSSRGCSVRLLSRIDAHEPAFLQLCQRLVCFFIEAEDLFGTGPGAIEYHEHHHSLMLHHINHAIERPQHVCRNQQNKHNVHRHVDHDHRLREGTEGKNLVDIRLIQPFIRWEDVLDGIFIYIRCSAQARTAPFQLVCPVLKICSLDSASKSNLTREFVAKGPQRHSCLSP